MLVNAILLWLVFYGLRHVAKSFETGRQIEEHFKRTGFSFSLIHISYETSAFNTFLFKLFNQTDGSLRRLFQLWFDAGVLCMALGQLVSVILLLGVFVHALLPSVFAANDSTSTKAEHPIPSDEDHMSPIIPSLHFTEKYIVSFCVCTFFVVFAHEFGHAAAAAMERLQIQGCGAFLLFLFPGAYVRIEESVQYLPMKAQLRVYSAGIWHNIVIVVLCFVALWNIPLMVSPWYDQVQGALVLSVSPTSPLVGALSSGDIISAINHNPVSSPRDFHLLLHRLHLLQHTTLLSPTLQTLLSEAASSTPLRGPQTLNSLSNQKFSLNHGQCVATETLDLYSSNHVLCCESLLLSDGSGSPYYDDEDSCFVHNAYHHTKQHTSAMYIAPAHHRRRMQTSFGGLRHDIAAAPGSTSDANTQTLSVSNGGATLPPPSLYCLPASHVYTTVSCLHDNNCHPNEVCLQSLNRFPVHIIQLTLRSGRSILFEGTSKELNKQLHLGQFDLRDHSSSLYFLLLAVPDVICFYIWLVCQVSYLPVICKILF